MASCVVGGGPPYQPSPYPSGRTLLSREETTPRSTPITDGSIPGEQQVQNKALLRPGLEPETSQPQRSELPLHHARLVVIVVVIVVVVVVAILKRRRGKW